ncbi:MFS transporter [Dactylosporangium vinaceum]|uniref:MFS transporter n=1 Tax=Dactylosporangium vinaceum TaxID=53362 RepID=A0ABV5MNS7_9ACTN|nr:MFS transporter [Dactylosporangium vinaceum]UAB95659.1 MFS transporter [Dactylosporangium vinaceum]
MSNPAESAKRPATIRETLGNREYAALFTAQAQSSLGDNVARAAVIALVYRQTNSPIWSAAAFAVSYLPWLGIGAVLSAWAERHAYRRTMIGCDLIRAALMVVLAAFPGLHIGLIIALLFANALLSPPFDASRSALMPQLLQGEQYVTAVTLTRTTGQVALIAGYALGATLAAYNGSLALLLNGVTFAVSAGLLAVAVKEREPSLKVHERTHLLREAVDGYRVVFRSPIMRSIALVVFTGVCFGVVPEGLAAAWAARLGEQSDSFAFGAIMTAAAAGFVIGSALVTWFLPPQRRVALIRPMALITPLALVPGLFDPSLPVIVVMTVFAGASLAITLPAGNGLFVQVLPPSYRARAFGVMQSGVHLLQGGSIVLTGWLATYYPLPDVVGYFGIFGLGVTVLIIAAWPAKATIADAIAANKVRVAAEQYAAADNKNVEDLGEVTIDLARVPLPPRRRPSPGPSARREPPMTDPAERTVDLSERTTDLGGLPPAPPSQAARHS